MKTVTTTTTTETTTTEMIINADGSTTTTKTTITVVEPHDYRALFLDFLHDVGIYESETGILDENLATAISGLFSQFEGKF